MALKEAIKNLMPLKEFTRNRLVLRSNTYSPYLVIIDLFGWMPIFAKPKSWQAKILAYPNQSIPKCWKEI